MNHIPAELKYLNTHEWVRKEGDAVFTIGITDHAQAELGDIVFVELAEDDSEVDEGHPVCVVESVKAASDIYAPFTGEIVEANHTLYEEPELVNTDAYGDGWLYKIRVDDESVFDNLMSAEDYKMFIGDV